jgi:LmbE family N-acetylglucosaminyl deacetylase
MISNREPGRVLRAQLFAALNTPGIPTPGSSMSVRAINSAAAARSTTAFTLNITALAKLLAFMTTPQTSANAQGRPRTLVALLAHADDETAASPVLARYAREGVQMHIIIASDGPAGSGSQTYLVRPDSGPQGEALAKVRADEARCAAAAIGANEPILLGFPDGKLGDYPGDRTLLSRLTERIAREIERLRPDVVVTWGPDGGTVHPDHRLISSIATQLQRFGAPGMPEWLFYMYLPAEGFRLLNPHREEPPMLIPRAQYFTVNVPFTPADLEAAQKAMACHRSQFTPEMLQRLLPEQRRLLNGQDRVHPSFSDHAWR